MGFSDIIRNINDRNFGGTDINQVAEPYLSGYHFSKWIFGAPTHGSQDFFNLGNPVNTEGISSSITSRQAEDILQATCLSVTPPGGTLNKTEITGLGGTKWSVPTNLDYGTTLSCKFLEMSGLPVFKVIHAWTRAIRDNRSGLTRIENPRAYNKANYAATVFYWTTKPDGRTVEFASCYTGVFPTKDPQDLFSGDVSSVDKLEMDLEFNVDFIYHEDWVFNKCKRYAESFDWTKRHGPGATVYGDKAFA